MDTRVPLFPEQASTFAPQVDALLFFLIGVSGAVVLLVVVLMLYFLVKYRRRSNVDYQPPYIRGSVRLEVFWTVTPLLFFGVMFVWGARIYVAMSQPPDDAIPIYVVG